MIVAGWWSGRFKNMNLRNHHAQTLVNVSSVCVKETMQEVLANTLC